MSLPLSMLALAFGLLGVGAATSLLAGKDDRFARVWSVLCATLGSLAAAAAGGVALATPGAEALALDSAFPLLKLSIRIDDLSAFFLLTIGGIGALSSLFSGSYVAHFFGRYRIGTLGFFYNAFIASMLLVVTAENVLLFLIAWELMSLASYFLVIYEHKEAENLRAGFQYFVMTHIGTALAIAALLILSGATGADGFRGIATGAGALSPWLRDSVFLLALLGFGVKAGIIPLHGWLPNAHPAAPSHVSALMSGVMIKTGIYMFMRLFLDVLPAPPLWWGLLIIALGAISALLGVLYALSEHDLKRLLAYHSIENIGIILLGLGSALAFLSLGLKDVALIGFIASLYHTLNHAIFKTLLFLSAGSVVAQMHTRNIEEYGGLARFMPYTASFFLVGSLAISGLPPFNGFMSEWMTFQGLFAGITASGPIPGFVFLLAAGALAFTSGLAAACFVKAFGATFLARPRSRDVDRAKEAAPASLFSMGALALLTLLLGVGAGLAAPVIGRVGTGLTGLAGASVTGIGTGAISAAATGASVSMPALAIILALALLGALGVALVSRRKRRVTYGATWDCGAPLGPRMEITATAFSRSIITVLRGVLRPTMQSTIEYRDATMRYFPEGTTVHLSLVDVYQKYLYGPTTGAALYVSEAAKRIQNGNTNVYILYMFVALVSLFIALSL